MKIKMDKRKIHDTSGAQKKVFDNLVDQLSVIAAKLDDVSPVILN